MKFLDFGQAIEALKDGKCLSREIWKGTDKCFIFKQVPAEIKSQIVPIMQSLPEGAKSLFEKSFIDNQEHAIYYANQIALVGLSNTIDSYSASAQDIFAEDWYIIN